MRILLCFERTICQELIDEFWQQRDEREARLTERRKHPVRHFFRRLAHWLIG